MKNKKAMTREQIVKLVFGILCLLVIVLAIVKVYQYGKGKSDLEKAKGTLAELEAGLNEARLYGESEMFVLTPSKWWVIAWPYENDPAIPEQCRGENCICVCKIPEAYQTGPAGSAEKCNEKGTCVNIIEKIKTIDRGLLDRKVDRPISIDDPPIGIVIKYTEQDGFVVEEKEK